MSNRMKSEYVSDSEAWLSEITGQKEQFDNSAAQIKSLLDKYGKYYGEDYVNSVIRYLDGNAEKQSRITASASSDNDYWKQFSKEEYEGWYDSQIYGKKYEGKSYSDIEKALSSVSSDRERAWLSANADSFMSSADAQEEIDRLKKENAEKYGKYSSHTVDYMNEFHSGPIPVKTPVRNEALDRIKELEGIRDSAKNREELAAYEEKYLSAAYEYANKLSRHNIQKTMRFPMVYWVFTRQSDTAPIKRNTTGNVPGTEAEDFAFTETGQKMLNKAVDGLLNGITNRDFMSDGENKMLRYLVYEKGAKEAERYLNTLQPELNRRSAEQMKQTVSEMVSNGNAAEKTFYNVASIGMNIVGGPIAFLDNLEQYVKGERIDPNRPGQAMRQIGSTIRTETDAGIDNNVMSMLYNAADVLG